MDSFTSLKNRLYPYISEKFNKKPFLPDTGLNKKMTGDDPNIRRTLSQEAPHV